MPLCKPSNVEKLRTYLGSLFIVELATRFETAGSSSGLYVNQVMLKICVHIWDPYLLLNWLHVSNLQGHHQAFM
jgi:hypothetical protein